MKLVGLGNSRVLTQFCPKFFLDTGPFESPLEEVHNVKCKLSFKVTEKLLSLPIRIFKYHSRI